MDYGAFVQAAGRGQPPPIALVHGPDAQLLDDALAAATRGLFRDPGEAALGREVFEGGETSVDAVVRAASTLPFMTAMRLVAVRRSQALAAKGADTLRDYARDPNPSTALLLLADESLAASRDRRDHWLLSAPPPKGSPSPTRLRGCWCSGSATRVRACSERRGRPRSPGAARTPRLA
jgi:DNA polymerase III delta subunit